ncbi:MAG: Holliday junction resolvase RecU, partial [Candidatus Hodarchaeales archaeon]
MAKKGKDLENLVNRTNIEYRKLKLALIQYIEVPIVLTRKGLVPKQSTVDFIGVVKGGRGIAFDAKST